ncbi:uncharacterized protein LOC104886557 isoform X1 [Beta vulgaris subsp. vulgaris]|uniref:uncharacterized protein LOC104886557 isoform X1 n=3 Tax=Beta vulgaris subsp. vulgaris TaxID=3555 RepID=UPI00053F5F96|nr:uncharacterized protein LOC104886557 isoform X1 [Beta vulgaris subsp. vulgaris]XP_048495041.1 uncharacterized protein LOC104886557 isoform X1 [Beta vulgaris subsp. vulgaris]
MAADLLELVEKIDRSIGQDANSSIQIGLLDMYGFECFKYSSFEQFCINFANEKLQQHFNEHVFKVEQEEYNREEINWSYIEFVDNQDVLDLIEKKPIEIIALLDEVCMFPESIHETFTTKLFQQFPSHPRSEKDYVPVRRSLFNPKSGGDGDGDAADDMIHWKGFQQTLQPTQMSISFNMGSPARLLCIAQVVIKSLKNKFGSGLLYRYLSDRECLKVEKALKGVIIEILHWKSRKQYKALGLSAQPSNQLTFALSGVTQESVPQFFLMKYKLMLPCYLSCLEVGSSRHPIYLPVEVCETVEARRCPKKLNGTLVFYLVNNCAISPLKRAAAIDIVRTHSFKLLGGVGDSSCPSSIAAKENCPPGIQNLGNTCFLNSLLQALASCRLNWQLPSFCTCVAQHCLYIQFGETIEKILNHTAGPIRPSSIIHLLHDVLSSYVIGQQEDSSELYVKLLSKSCFKRLRDFFTLYRSGYEVEDIHFILELQDGTTSSSVQHLLQGTVFSKCPQILTCYVGYSFKENGEKLKRNLVCERHLTLRSSSNGVEIGVRYQFVAAVIHTGQCFTMGHYFTVAAVGDDIFMLFDDETVKVFDQELHFDEAYMLFYKKMAVPVEVPVESFSLRRSGRTRRHPVHFRVPIVTGCGCGCLASRTRRRRRTTHRPSLHPVADTELRRDDFETGMPVESFSLRRSGRTRCQPVHFRVPIGERVRLDSRPTSAPLADLAGGFPVRRRRSSRTTRRQFQCLVADTEVRPDELETVESFSLRRSGRTRRQPVRFRVPIGERVRLAFRIRHREPASSLADLAGGFPVRRRRSSRATRRLREDLAVDTELRPDELETVASLVLLGVDSTRRPC